MKWNVEKPDRKREAGWRERLPAGQDRVLALAGRFLALMLALTLVARGTAGAVMPVVTVARPAQGSVVHTVSAGGTVASSGGVPFTLPGGLLVTGTPVQVGQSVEAGQPLVVFDAAEVRRAILHTQAQLNQLRVQSEQENKGTSADPYSAQLAQEQLLRAYADSEAVWAEGESAVGQAEAALSSAQASLDGLRSLPLPVSTPEQAAREEALHQAEEALQQARAALDAAREEADAANETALDRAQSAEDSRNTALHNFYKESEQAADATALSRAQAGVTAAEMATLRAELERLQALHIEGESAYFSAPLSGTLTRLDCTVGKTSPAVGGVLAAADAPQVLTAALAAEDAAWLSVGSEVTVTQGARSAKTALTALSAPDQENMVTVTVQLPAGSWKNGAASLEASARGGQGWTLPVGALHRDNGGDFVWAVEAQDTVLGLQNVTVRRQVTVSERGTDTAIVGGAVSPDTQVIVSADKPVSAGARVRLDA